jgi:hypothetical protein
MRYYEISSGFRIPVSEEEQQLLDRAGENRCLMRSDLSEREEHMAWRMVSRGLLNQETDENHKIFFIPNDANDLWRY